MQGAFRILKRDTRRGEGGESRYAHAHSPTAETAAETFVSNGTAARDALGLSECALRRARASAGAALGPQPVEALASLIYEARVRGGGGGKAAIAAAAFLSLDQQKCTILRGFSSSVAAYESQRLEGLKKAARVANANIVPPLKGVRGVLFFSSASTSSSPEEDLLSYELSEETPRGTLWSRLLADLSALRSLTSADVNESGGVSCGIDSSVAFFLEALRGACLRGDAPPPTAVEREELARHTGRLLLSALMGGAADGLAVCAESFDGGADGLPPPLVFCLPLAAADARGCAAHRVWSAPRGELIAWWHEISTTAATLVLTLARSADSVRRLLTYALAVGEIAGWHPSGVSAPGSRELLYAPQHMFYFASSYYFVHLEKEYKAQLHSRLAGAVARLPHFTNTLRLLEEASDEADALAAEADAGARRARPPCAGDGRPRLLILSSYWDRGHSSHRISAPLSIALARHTCATLWSASGELEWNAAKKARAEAFANATLAGADDAVARAVGDMAAFLAHGGHGRGDDTSAFVSVARYPSKESLSLQLGLWAVLRDGLVQVALL